MKHLTLLLSLALLSCIAMAESGVTYTLGDTKPRWHTWDHGRAHRLAYVHGIPMQDNLLSRNHIGLNIEFAYHYWQDFTPDDKHGASITPMFSFQYPVGDMAIFLEAGIGITYIDSDDYLDRHLGSKWQFEDKLAAGIILFSHHKIGLSFIHYSNANLANENDGFNAIGLSYGYFW